MGKFKDLNVEIQENYDKIFNVKDKRFPKWENISSENKIVNDLSNIDVEILAAPTLDEILDMSTGCLLSTWDACGRHKNPERNKAKLDYVDKEEALKLFYRACRGGFLQAFLENVNITVLFDGINWQDVTHLIRSRKMAFFADCSGDKLLNTREITIPESFVECGYAEEYSKLVNDMMTLYCKLMNDKRISHHDARLVTPKTMGTFYYVKMNLGDAIRVCHQRFDHQTQPKSDTIMMAQLWLEICRKYPFLSTLLDYDETNKFYIHECNTNFASMFYQPLPQNEKVYEYTSAVDYLYDKNPDELAGAGKDSVYRKLMDSYRTELKELQKKAKEEFPFLYTKEYEEDYK